MSIYDLPEETILLLQRKGTNPAEARTLIGDWIMANGHFAKDPSRALYRWCDGRYVPDGGWLGESVTRMLRTVRRGFVSTTFVTETAAYIMNLSPALWDGEELRLGGGRDRICLRNGILDISDPAAPVLKPHDPTFLSPLQIPVVYDPVATCPAIEQFMSEVLPADVGALCWEIPIDLITTNRDIKKAIILEGGAHGGKSLFLAVMRAFVGAENCSSITLQSLGSNRFAAYGLVGKLANICADLPSAHLSDTSSFKALTGGDTIRVERKGVDGFDYHPYVRLLFSANAIPRSDDDTDAFLDRWVVIPFPHCFEGRNAIPRSDLIARLTTAGELSGMLNRGLAVLAALRKRRDFTESRSTLAARAQFEAETSPWAAYSRERVLSGPGLMIGKDDLRDDFRAWCERRRITPPTENALGRKLRAKGWTDAQRIYKGRKQVWVWLGYGLRSETDQEVPAGSRTA
jgi:putative DNA primase/helicase